MSEKPETNSNDSLALLNRLEDHWSWEKFIQQCDRIKIEESYRQRAKDSFVYLRKLLGIGFLKRAFTDRHPIYTWYFSDAAPGAKLSLIRFVDSLRAFEDAPNFKRIVKRIKRPLRTAEDFQDITEAMSAFSVAHRFSQAGFHVELEPSIQTINDKGAPRTKKPDLRIIDKDNEQAIVVEVSRMMASKNQTLTSATYEVVFNLLVHWGMQSDPEAFKDILNPRHILPYAIIHRGIEREELDEIAQRLTALVEHVRTTGEFGELIIPETIEVGIASYDNHDLAKKWAKDKGMKEGETVRGANIESDEVARVKVKIREKLKQLPINLPGMIVIEAGKNLLFFVYDIRWLALTFQEEVRIHRQLLRTVMFHSFVDGSAESTSIEIGPHTFRHQVRRDGSAEESLTIRNIDYGLDISPETIAKLDSVFARSG